MKIKMKLLTDTIFGNGISVPGGEDISILTDKDGFPYYRGTSLKGVFREELERYVKWTENERGISIGNLLGNSGDDEFAKRLVFSDLTLSKTVREAVLDEIGNKPSEVTEATSNIRTFTSINENGIAEKGSLRMARCADKGLIFYGDILCNKEDEEWIKEVLGLIKSIGTMRNRGFGKVRIESVEE